MVDCFGRSFQLLFCLSQLFECEKIQRIVRSDSSRKIPKNSSVLILIGMVNDNNRMDEKGNTKGSPKKYVAGYVRTAVVSDGNEIVAQIEKIVKMAKGRDGFNVERIYIDNGCSGLDTNHSQMKNLMKDIEKGYIKEVYASSPSRISRNFESYCEFVEFAKKNGVRVVDSIDASPNLGNGFFKHVEMPGI